ncbi:MAG: RNA methyltransferase [Oligoflexia bacterium]|nr:RNA methyltransferase [Oligoflexia bacterium]
MFNDHYDDVDDIKIIEILSPYVSDERKQKIDSILAQRTYTITCILDNIHDEGNINAVIRTAENFGYQSLNIISSQKIKKSNRVTRGTDKWIDIKRFDDYHTCLSEIKAKGFKILATSLSSEKAMPLSAIDEKIFCSTSSPLAIIFGNEKDGVRKELVEAADYVAYISTVGFAQSFNISVAAAIALYHVYQSRVKIRGGQGDLSESELLRLRARFYYKSVNNSEKIINHFLRGRKLNEKK